MLIRSRQIMVPAVLLAAVFALAGCSAASGGTSSGAIAHSEPQSEVQQPAPGSAPASGDVVKRSVVTTGTVVIRTKNPIAAADRAARIVDDVGGRVDDSTQTAATKTTPASASLTLRIPASKLTPTLAELKKVGTEESISTSTNDVTTQSEDLGARITALQTSITRLLALEAKATATSDVIELENDISSRQGDLESLQAQQRYLNDQVAMSTITLNLIAPSVPLVKPGPPSAATAFFAGFSGFGLFFTWLFLAVIYLLPWLVLVAIVWVALVVLLRYRRRRRRDSIPPPPPPVG
jgi:hypothetical protein